MVVTSSSVNMEWLIDGDVEMDTRLNMYYRKWRLLLVLNLSKYTIKKSKDIKVKKNIKKIFSIMSRKLRLRQKMVFL